MLAARRNAGQQLAFSLQQVTVEITRRGDVGEAPIGHAVAVDIRHDEAGTLLVGALAGVVDEDFTSRIGLTVTIDVTGSATADTRENDAALLRGTDCEAEAAKLEAQGPT